MWKLLGSTRLAIVLIVLVTLLLIISALVPQTGIADAGIADLHEQFGNSYVIVERLGLDRIYYSPTFYAVLGLLAANLTVGTVRRFRGVLRSEGTLLRLRHIGSIVFHLSLLLIIFSVIANYLYKFDGVFAVTEGQEVQDDADSYFRIFSGPLHQPESGRFRLRLNELTGVSYAGGAGTAVARVAFLPTGWDSALVREIATNRPLKYGSLEVHYGLVDGYSPELVVIDSGGNRLFGGFVRLATQVVDGHRQFEDFVMLPRQELTVSIEALPAVGEAEAPVFHVRVSGPDSTALESPVAAGDTLTASGYRFILPRWRRWCYLNVVENPYLNVVFFGFWSALAGLAVGLVSRVAPRRQGMR